MTTLELTKAQNALLSDFAIESTSIAHAMESISVIDSATGSATLCGNPMDFDEIRYALQIRIGSDDGLKLDRETARRVRVMRNIVVKINELIGVKAIVPDLDVMPDETEIETETPPAKSLAFLRQSAILFAYVQADLVAARSTRKESEYEWVRMLPNGIWISVNTEQMDHLFLERLVTMAFHRQSWTGNVIMIPVMVRQATSGDVCKRCGQDLPVGHSHDGYCLICADICKRCGDDLPVDNSHDGYCLLCANE